MKARDIYISAGHTNVAGRDRGAAANGHIEGVLAADLRRDIVSGLRSRGVTVHADSDDSILAETLRWARNLTTNRCIVIDLHWNSASPTATGTETLVPSDASFFEIMLAQSFSQTVSDTLGLRLRGGFGGMNGVRSELESHHGRLGFMRLTGENILPEICFISNPNDMGRFNSNRSELVNNIVTMLDNFSMAEVGRVSTSGGALNMRNQPSANGVLINRLMNGQQVITFQQENGFYRIGANMGGRLTLGWASSNFIKIQK
jgi:N-acetylmuramoyl-L-alanine amidase